MLLTVRMLKIGRKHEAELAHHAAVLDEHDGQLAGLFLLVADVVADDRHAEIARHDFLDGGNAVDLHDDAIVLNAAAMADEIALEQLARARCLGAQHELFVRQLVQRHARALREWVVGRRDQAQVIRAQQDGRLAA